MLDTHQIKAAARAVDDVKSIDDTIKRMGEAIDCNAPEYGEALRKAIGRNLLSQFKDSDLGEIAFCGVVNALLRRRSGIVEAHGEVVQFPEPPCPVQSPSNPDL